MIDAAVVACANEEDASTPVNHAPIASSASDQLARLLVTRSLTVAPQQAMM
jgi:hypothetical protein